MFDENIDFDCDECGGAGPPPKFMIPPPPRPPFMQELSKCREDDDEINSSNYISSSSSSSKSDNNNIFYSNSDINWDNSDICEAIPILDASYHSSPSLQTSAMIAVFSLLLVLVVLISSLFVWKHKRKVQNFLPCKTNTRGPHIGGGVTVGHSVTYEDPDAPLGHRPLMMRHHHNVEMLTKSVHYPSGYPMTRSPPHLVCNSPGPDPYRSNDNVYEELGPARTSENESELAQSDDDFAEDELSLPGERNLNKLSPENKNINSGPVSTIYHEQCSSSTNQQQINGNERNSLVNSSASNYNQRLNNKNANIGNNSNSNCNNSTPSRLGIFSGVFRNTTGRSNKNNPNNNIVQQNNRNRCQNHKTLPHNHDELNRLALAEQNCRQQSSNNQIQSDVIIPPTQLIYDDVASRNNLMQLAYNHGNNFPPTINSSNIINSSRMNNLHDQHCYNTLDSEVERRNRINQLHHTPGVIPPVATIFRGTGAERINYTSRYPQPYYTSQPNNILSLQKSRTNPRSLDRRRIIAAISADEPNYGYAEPVFHEGLLYNTKNTTNTPTNSTILRQPYQSYVLPNYSNTTTAPINSGSYRTLNNHNHYPTFNNQQYYYHPLHPQNLDQHQQQLYSRDSSFTSDSGYSHQTSSSTGNNRTNNCPNNIHDNRINNGNGKTSISSNKPINLSLPSSDSSCIGASNSNNGPNSMNCIKLQSNNCDKENSNHHHNNKTNINNIPSFSWARTRAANLNSNHINSKKCKDNNTGTALSLDLITSSNNPTMNTSKSIERINCSSSSGCSGSRIPNNSFENDSSDTERNFQIDNQKLNFNNHINNCLSSSPNNNSNSNNNNNNNHNSNNTNNNNNNSINNTISSDENSRTIINNESNNSFNNINNNNNNSCKSQS